MEDRRHKCKDCEYMCECNADNTEDCNGCGCDYWKEC